MLEELKDKLFKAHESGEFWEQVKSIYFDKTPNHRENLSLAIIELHNTSLIDINKLFTSILFEKERYDYLILEGIYSSVIPMISCSASDLIMNMKALLEQGKEISSLCDNICKFCQRDESYPREALSLINDNIEILSQLISTVIISANEHSVSWCLEQIKSLIHNDEPLVRTQAYWAIGKLSFTSQNDADIAFLLLKESSEQERDKSVKCTILRSSILFGKKNERYWKDLEIIINNLLELKDQNLVRLAVIMANHDLSIIPDNIIFCLINYIKNTNILDMSIFDDIDYLLVKLAKESRLDILDDLLEKLFFEYDDLNIARFDYFSHYILNDNRSLLNRMVTKWFLSGNQKLYRTIFDLFRSSSEKNIELNVDREYLKISDEKKYFLAKKTIGWLFIFPIPATSFIFSLYEMSSNKLKIKLEELLFDYLLMNYPGELKKYIEPFKKEDCFTNLVNSLFSMLDKYFDDIKDAYDIKELSTSQKNRELYWAMADKKMQEARDKGPKSIFEDLMTVQHLLYGNSAINYVYPPLDESPMRSETPMHEFSVSTEMPNMDVIDPSGINYKLLSFRLERWNEADN